MTSQRGGRKGKAGSGARSGKLRVKKETLKDLDAKSGSKVGGAVAVARSINCDTSTCVTCTCFSCLICPMAH